MPREWQVRAPMFMPFYIFDDFFFLLYFLRLLFKSQMYFQLLSPLPVPIVHPEQHRRQRVKNIKSEQRVEVRHENLQ